MSTGPGLLRLGTIERTCVREGSGPGGRTQVRGKLTRPGAPRASAAPRPLRWPTAVPRARAGSRTPNRPARRAPRGLALAPSGAARRPLRSRSGVALRVGRPSRPPSDGDLGARLPRGAQGYTRPRPLAPMAELVDAPG